MNSFLNSSLACAVLAGVASGQSFAVQVSPPSEDRWNYPFAPTPGMELEASTFGATLVPGFDDYDGQFIVGFRTAALVPPGRGAGQYQVERCVVRLTVANDQVFVYDPTPDSFRTFLPGTDADALPDEDAGRAIELFGVGYRGAFTRTTWFETAPFGGAPVVPPAQQARFAFASVLDDAGASRDVSLRVRERFDVAPFAVGLSSVAPGERVPAGTEFVFEVNLCRGGAALEIARGLDAGVVRFTVASLSPATGGPGGGGGEFPRWVTRENVLALPPFNQGASIELSVRVGPAADYTTTSDPLDPLYGVPDGVVDASDFFFYLDLFAADDARADLTGSSDPSDPAYGRPDCTLDASDFFFYLDAFVGG